MTDRQGPKHIRVFIASPGDLDEERIVFREVCEKLNNGFGDGIGVEFIADGWENVPSQVGRRNQSVINEKVDQCDVFFLVIHRRWGQDSSDSEYTSYTEEELHRALNRRNEKGRPEIYVFFKNVDPGQLDDPGPQLQKVLAFRNELEATRKALYRTFSDSTEFENEVDYHLRDVARRVVSTRENMPQISAGERAQVPDGKPIEVPAAQLEEPRQKESSITKNKLRVFLSYSHRDLKELNRLKVHLANYKHNDVIEIWHDRQIKAGSEWEAEILQELEKADIILLLVSPDFIASDFCRLTETKHALQRHQKGAALVIPISLKLVAEFPQEISGLQRVPGGDKPITKYRTHADGYVKAVQLIMEAVESFAEKQSVVRFASDSGIDGRARHRRAIEVAADEFCDLINSDISPMIRDQIVNALDLRGSSPESLRDESISLFGGNTPRPSFYCDAMSDLSGLAINPQTQSHDAKVIEKVQWLLTRRLFPQRVLTELLDRMKSKNSAVIGAVANHIGAEVAAKGVHGLEPEFIRSNESGANGVAGHGLLKFVSAPLGKPSPEEDLIQILRELASQIDLDLDQPQGIDDTPEAKIGYWARRINRKVRSMAREWWKATGPLPDTSPLPGAIFYCVIPQLRKEKHEKIHSLLQMVREHAPALLFFELNPLADFRDDEDTALEFVCRHFNRGTE